MRLLGGTSRGDINMMHPAYTYTTCVNNTGDVPLSNLSSQTAPHSYGGPLFATAGQE